MKTCENCKWFDGYTGTDTCGGSKEYHCKVIRNVDLTLISVICQSYERKTMNTKDCYKFMQAEWIKLYNVEIGDIVRVLRVPKHNELGCWALETDKKKEFVGNSYVIDNFYNDSIKLHTNSIDFLFPFFCLEFVKKAEPVIEITVTVNHKEVPLNTLSKETLLRIRDKT